MDLMSQHLANKGQKTPTDQKISPPVAEITNAQDFKKERQACSKIILAESHANGKKECLWISLKPASTFEEYFESIPKGKTKNSFRTGTMICETAFAHSGLSFTNLLGFTEKLKSVPS